MTKSDDLPPVLPFISIREKDGGRDGGGNRAKGEQRELPGDRKNKREIIAFSDRQEKMFGEKRR